MDLKTILEMWSVDSIIEETSLDEASRQSPILHAKYLELHSLTRLRLKKAEQKQGINV